MGDFNKLLERNNELIEDWNRKEQALTSEIVHKEKVLAKLQNQLEILDEQNASF